jgi:hypothetical protein
MAPHAQLKNDSGPFAAPLQCSEPVLVDVDSCRRVAQMLRTRDIPPAQEDSSLPGLRPELVGNFYLLLVAICHQTSPRGKQPLEGNIKHQQLRGWDYLSAKLEEDVLLDPQLLNPTSWANFSSEDIRDLFRDKEFGERLSDPTGRAALVRDLGQKMLERSWRSADQIYLASRRIAGEFPSLLSLLSEFRAYDDPVRKKSYFFLSLMQNANLWTYTDPENLGAPVDYHEVRGHLRIGTVQISDLDLRSKLLAGHDVTPEEDVKIRTAVHDALMLISTYSGLRNPSQTHYLFWNVFRSCCTRENPHCSACPPTCTLPSRYIPLAMFSSGAPRRCPFSEVCQSAGREPKLLEQTIDTDYY